MLDIFEEDKVLSYEEDVLNGVHPFIINDIKDLVMGNELRNSYITSSVEENKGGYMECLNRLMKASFLVELNALCL